MSNEREELQGIVADALNHPQHGEFALDSRRVAARVLAAGYRKPQQVTTVEELDALPDESVVRSERGFVYEISKDKDDPTDAFWVTPGDSRMYPSSRIALPATVLHEAKP